MEDIRVPSIDDRDWTPKYLGVGDSLSSQVLGEITSAPLVQWINRQKLVKIITKPFKFNRKLTPSARIYPLIDIPYDRIYLYRWGGIPKTVFRSGRTGKYYLLSATYSYQIYTGVTLVGYATRSGFFVVHPKLDQPISHSEYPINQMPHCNITELTSFLGDYIPQIFKDSKLSESISGLQIIWSEDKTVDPIISWTISPDLLSPRI